MSKRVKNRKILKKAIITFIISVLIWILLFYLYITYSKIEIKDSNYQTQQVQSTIKEQTVENTEKNSKKIADVIEETTQSIVGISKLKNTGTSIFSNNTENELGLGTGIIVTEDGYILS